VVHQSQSEKVGLPGSAAFQLHRPAINAQTLFAAGREPMRDKKYHG
jgi:hypothetical protein